MSEKIKHEDITCGWDREAVAVAYDEIKHATPKAVLFSVGGKELWVPKSVMADIDADQVWIANWFADEEGLS